MSFYQTQLNDCNDKFPKSRGSTYASEGNHTPHPPTHKPPFIRHLYATVILKIVSRSPKLNLLFIMLCYILVNLVKI